MEVSFDRAEPGASKALEKLVGTLQAPRPALCDGKQALAKPTAAGVTLFFRNRAFVGWQSQDGAAGELCQVVAN